MKALRYLAVSAVVVGTVSFSGCSKPIFQVTELKRYPINGTDGLITQSGVTLQHDKE